jgi:molybdate transport system permease protein
MTVMSKSNFWTPVVLSLEVTVTASILAFILALLAAWMMKDRKFKGKTIVETCFLLPLVLPPSVVGFGLLVALGRRSIIGQAIEWLFNQPVVFTWWAAVIAATVVAFPLCYMTVKTGFDQIDRNLEDAARTMGASTWQLFIYVLCPLSWRTLLTGYILGFARAIGEFGATLMFAGNIPGQTQTIPTAIYIAVESGNMNLAYYWVALIVFFSFVLLISTQRIKGYT